MSIFKKVIIPNQTEAQTINPTLRDVLERKQKEAEAIVARMERATLMKEEAKKLRDERNKNAGWQPYKDSLPFYFKEVKHTWEFCYASLRDVNELVDFYTPEDLLTSKMSQRCKLMEAECDDHHDCLQCSVAVTGFARVLKVDD